MEKQKRIAAVHDLSGLGKCSLTVALPVISASGVECACLPTALLSTHTGEFRGYTFKDLSDQLLPIAEHWKREGLEFDGIYSGYLACAEQEETLEQVIELLSGTDTRLITDPVMADNGAYYSNHGDEMCRAFRRLCKRADIITPNITEAALLTGMPYMSGVHSPEYIDRLLCALSELCGGIVAVTGVCTGENRVGVIAVDSKSGQRFLSERAAQPGVFYGTGDIFASAFSALLVRGAGLRNAVETAVSLVADSIERSVKRDTPRRCGVDFEGALPAYIQTVEALFK